MKGKGSALQDNQRAGDRKSQRLHRVADDLTLVEAASILDGQTAVVDNR
jgi:hypothetical protein